MLLFFLLLLAALVILFGGLYLWLRKPVTELPIPGLVTEAVPHYSYSIYGVTKPTGVAVDPSGDRIYVTETDGDRVVRIFDGKGSPVGIIKPPATTGAEHTPVYVALDPTSGDVYVSDRPTGSIYIYDRDGLWRRTFDPGKDLKGWQPLGLGFDAKGNLYVTDVSGPFNTVHEFGPDGTLIRTIGEAGMFSFPNGVSVDAAGNLYVTDSNHGRLVVFDAGGKQRAVIKRGPGQGDLGLPARDRRRRCRSGLRRGHLEPQRPAVSGDHRRGPAAQVHRFLRRRRLGGRGLRVPVRGRHRYPSAGLRRRLEQRPCTGLELLAMKRRWSAGDHDSDARMGGIDSVLLSTLKGNESMRRLALLAVGGALWLFAAAIPALADGGPHIAALNNGSGGLTSDTCAGCHRAHTAQGAMLLKEEGTALCTSCHGSAGTGATTNVADGVQYQLAAAGGPTLRGSVLGALRNGGFTNARIGSASAVAVSYLSGTRHPT